MLEGNCHQTLAKMPQKFPSIFSDLCSIETISDELVIKFIVVLRQQQLKVYRWYTRRLNPFQLTCRDSFARPIPIPSYTDLCRRFQGRDLGRRGKKSRPILSVSFCALIFELRLKSALCTAVVA
jgi:hypothetical protein